MASLLSNFANNLSERIHRTKCKFRYNDKNVKCDCFLEYINFKDDLTEGKYLCCNKNYQHKFEKS